MSSNENSPPSPPSPTFARRASFSPGQTFSGIFGRTPPGNTASGTSAFPGSIATAAANAQNRRRMSINTLGLSGNSPTQPSPFGTSPRSGSISSGGSIATDESVIEEGDCVGPVTAPTTPFARRMSFGARALRDSRAGGSPTGGGGNSGTTNGRAAPLSSTSSNFPTSSKLSSSPQQPQSNPRAVSHSEGFTWSESLRSRAERTSSITAANSSRTPHHHRTQSAAAADIPPPVREMPKAAAPPPAAARVPDPFQERILKGDFYMD